MDVVEQVKDLLVTDKSGICLFDFMVEKTRELLERLSDDEFAGVGWHSGEELLKVVQACENVMLDACKVQALVAFWGTVTHRDSLTLAVKRLAGELRSGSRSQAG